MYRHDDDDDDLLGVLVTLEQSDEQELAGEIRIAAMPRLLLAGGIVIQTLDINHVHLEGAP